MNIDIYIYTSSMKFDLYIDIYWILEKAYVKEKHVLKPLQKCCSFFSSAFFLVTDKHLGRTAFNLGAKMGYYEQRLGVQLFVREPFYVLYAIDCNCM